LLGEERDVVKTMAVFARAWVPVEQVIDVLVRDHAVDDLRDILVVDFRVKCCLRIRDNERAHLAETLAARNAQANLVDELAIHEVSLDGALHVVGAASLARRAGAYREAHFPPTLPVTYPLSQFP
jgi:hypothetical protein